MNRVELSRKGLKNMINEAVKKKLSERNITLRKKSVKTITESDLHNMVRKSVNRLLKEEEEFDGYDNDLEYENIYDEAYHYIISNVPREMSWREIAEGIGFRMETIGPNDMETLKEAIEDAMTCAAYDGPDTDDFITNWGDHNYDI